jgi:membrane protease YdiL (CAAX protease family)
VLSLYSYFHLLRDWLILAGELALPMFCLGWYVRQRRDGLFGPQRRRAVPWTGPEVLGVFFVSLVAGMLCHDFFRQTVVLDWLYGPPSWSEEVIRQRRSLWAMTFAVPLEVAGTLFLLYLASGTRPYQLGLTLDRFPANCLAGFLYWLVLMPGVLLFYALTQRLYELWLPHQAEPHTIQKLIQEGRAPADRALMALTALIAAPLWEELFFRGVLQRWLTCRTLRSDVVVGLSILLAVMLRKPGIVAALSESAERGQLLWELQPLFFVLILLPAYAAIRFWARSPAPPAIFAAALLFAITHAPVWPSPVPLFPLGLTLGWLAYRTQSLVAPVVLHLLFNAVAVLGLLHQDGRLPEPSSGRAATVTAVRAPETSASSLVPGASFPRRIYASAIGPRRGETTDDVTWPASVVAWNSFVPAGSGAAPAPIRPRKWRFTWPRSRAMTIGSWPR